MESGENATTKVNTSTSLMRKLYRITKHYTAAAQVIPNPRVLDLNTSTVVGGSDTELERSICSKQSRSKEWENATDDEIKREFNNYPEHVIPENEGKENEMRQQYIDCLNRTATLLKDLASEGDSSNEILDDELFYNFPFERPTTTHHTFLADSEDESVPDDIIFPIAVEKRDKLKRTAEQQILRLRIPFQEMAVSSESPPKKRKTK